MDEPPEDPHIASNMEGDPDASSPAADSGEAPEVDAGGLPVSDLEDLPMGAEAEVAAEMMRYVRSSVDGGTTDGATNTTPSGLLATSIAEATGEGASDSNIASYTRGNPDMADAASGTQNINAEEGDEGRAGSLEQDEQQQDASTSPAEDGDGEGGAAATSEPAESAPAAEDATADELAEPDTSPAAADTSPTDEEGAGGGASDGEEGEAGGTAEAVPPASVAETSRSGSPAGTRPASGQGSSGKPSSRPMSARPTSARPPSALARSSRPPSGSQPAAASSSSPSSRPPSGGNPLVVSSSRPASGSQPPLASSSRPSSRPPSGSQPPAAASSSRPPSGSQPPSLPPPAEGDESEQPTSAPASPAAPSAPQPTTPAFTLELKHVAPGLKALDVEIAQGQGLPYKVVRVLLDSTQLDRKLYLGGFRSKSTGATYHHAATQTPRQPKYTEADRKLSRDTQTVKMLPHSQQTKREAATQMARPGVVIDETYDRERTPGKYQTADEWLAIVEAATRTIQRWARGWAGRKRATYLREKKQERELFLREQELRAQQEAEEHRRAEIERRMHPRTAADFEILYNELEAWRLQETRKIKEAGLPLDKEQEVLKQLLHKETKLLQTIDRLKINANHENKDIRIQRTLGAMGKPKQFELKNGGKVEVHTPFTTRAKELQQLYNGLNLPNLSVEERLDVLLHVKWTVKEFDCALSREIVQLIDREADILNRARSDTVLEGLRTRISNRFLIFTETPEFNPEASRFQIVPMEFEAFLYDQADRPHNTQRSIAAR